MTNLEGKVLTMNEQRDPARLAAELHDEQDAAMARLTDMGLTDAEAHFALGALSFSAPAAFQMALDTVQRHRDGDDKIGAPKVSGLCRCSWLGAGTPPHDRSGFHPTARAPEGEGQQQCRHRPAPQRLPGPA